MYKWSNLWLCTDNIASLLDPYVAPASHAVPPQRKDPVVPAQEFAEIFQRGGAPVYMQAAQPDYNSPYASDPYNRMAPARGSLHAGMSCPPLIAE